LAKVPAQCIFCAHVNPSGAKFCNDCGSPLHLKPCRQCDAINDRGARRCYNCGIADPVLEPPPEPAPNVVATAAAAGSAAPTDVHTEAAVPAPQQISGALPDDHGTTMVHEPDAVVAAPQPYVADGDAGFAFPEIAHEQRAAERPRRSRWPVAGVLSATVVAAVAVYVYRTDLFSQQPREAPFATQAPAAATEPIPAKIDVPAAIATTAEPVAAAPTAPPAAAAGAGDSHAAIPSATAKKSPTSAKTTAKKAKKPSPKKVAPTPATPASKAATTQVPKTAQYPRGRRPTIKRPTREMQPPRL